MRYFVFIRTIAIAFVLLTTTLLPTSAQTIRRVTMSGAATGTNGSNWTDQAMSLQAALAVSSSGDQVWIAAGIYKPHANDRTATFRIHKAVQVYGGFAGTEDETFDPATNDTRIRNMDGTFTNETILSGDLLNDDGMRPTADSPTDEEVATYNATRDDNSKTVVTITGADVTLDGLTIKDGEDGTTIVISRFPRRVGAGLYAPFANTSLNACTFKNNAGRQYSNGIGAYFGKQATLTDCTFTDNHLGFDGYGGGAYFGGQTTLTGCTFADNRVGINGDGGGAYFGGQTTLTGCTFTGNEALASSGGAYFRGQTTLISCVFTGNQAGTSGGGVRFYSGGTVINSTFHLNRAISGNGGGIFVSFQDIDPDMDGMQTFPFVLQNSILMGNRAFYSPGAHQVYVANRDPSIVAIQHNLIEDGALPVAPNLNPDVDPSPIIKSQGVKYGNLSSTNITEDNTLDEDDLAVVFASTDATQPNFLRLLPDSPAVNAGNNAYVPTGSMTDAEGNVRIQRTVDLGAYERIIPNITTFTLGSLETPVVGVGDNGEVVSTLIASIAGGVAGSNTGTRYVSNPQNGGLIGNWQQSSDGGTSWTNVPAGDDLMRIGDTDLIRFNATAGAGVASLMLYALYDMAQGAASYADFAAAELAFPTISDPQALTVTVREPVIFRVAETVAGTEDGSSWDNAMTLEDALVEATLAGDRIWIAAGSYTPYSADEPGTFNIQAEVSVYGGFAGDEADDFDPATTARTGGATILSGDFLGNDLALPARPTEGASDADVAFYQEDLALYNTSRIDNSYTVVTILGAGVTLDGLIIEDGEGGTNVGDFFGGGLYAERGVATGTVVNNCLFRNNTSISEGGGAYFGEPVTLTECTFIDNSSRYGGGVSFYEDATLTNCTFTGNKATANGGGVNFDEGATLMNCVFANNSAEDDGGALWIRRGGMIINSTFYNNTTTSGQGGGVFINFSGSTSSFTLQNSILIGNTAMDAASGRQVYVNNTDAAHKVNIQHNLIEGEADPMGTDQGIVYAGATSANITEDNTIGESDPAVVFVTTDATQLSFLRSATGSPVLNAGNNNYVPTEIMTDVAGAVRIQDGTVDLGAYERRSTLAIFRVTEAATGSEDGSSWENAMTLQDALGEATLVGDQVWIAAGTYKPHADDMNNSFTIQTGVFVYGGFAGDEDNDFNPGTTARAGGETILSGDLLDNDIDRPAATAAQADIDAYNASRIDNSYTVVTILGAAVTLDGLIIEGGEEGTNVGDFFGGGLYAKRGVAIGVLVNNCLFRNNTSISEGGGAYFGEPVTLTECTFIDNSSRYGGGVSFYEDATLTNCTFTDNNATGRSGGANFDEGATLMNCVFANNSAEDDGGALWIRRGGMIINSTFYNNTTTSGQGGGVFINFSGSTSSFTLQNSILMGNTAMDAASGRQVYVNNTDAAHEVNIQHNLIEGGATVGISYQTPGAAGITEAATIDESDVAVVFASTDATQLNFLRLATGSLAVNVGDNSYIPAGVMTDAAGNDRIQGGTVDLGLMSPSLPSPDKPSCSHLSQQARWERS